LFGSHARGNAGTKSDIDLIIEFGESTQSLFDVIKIKNDLEHRLGKNVGILESCMRDESFAVIDKVVLLYG